MKSWFMKKAKGATRFGTPNPCPGPWLTLTGSKHRSAWHHAASEYRQMIPTLFLRFSAIQS